MNRTISTRYTFALVVLAALLSITVVDTASARPLNEDFPATLPPAGSVRPLSGTIVLDQGCDGVLSGDPLLTDKVALQIVDLRGNQVVATVDAIGGTWTATVPLQGEYGATIPSWVTRLGYRPSPDGRSILSAPSYTSAALSSLAPAGPIGLCRIH